MASAIAAFVLSFGPTTAHAGNSTSTSRTIAVGDRSSPIASKYNRIASFARRVNTCSVLPVTKIACSSGTYAEYDPGPPSITSEYVRVIQNPPELQPVLAVASIMTPLVAPPSPPATHTLPPTRWGNPFNAFPLNPTAPAPQPATLTLTLCAPPKQTPSDSVKKPP